MFAGTNPANKKRTTRIENPPRWGYHFPAFRTPAAACFRSKKSAAPGFLFLRIPRGKGYQRRREKENPAISVPYQKMPGGLYVSWA
jgi:hypothetical protein